MSEEAKLFKLHFSNFSDDGTFRGPLSFDDDHTIYDKKCLFSYCTYFILSDFKAKLTYFFTASSG